MFAKKCQECQQEYGAIQRERAALEVRTSMGIKTKMVNWTRVRVILMNI